jgi:hypothetical protein
VTLSVNPAKATEQFAFDRAVVFSPVKSALISYWVVKTERD